MPYKNHIQLHFNQETNRLEVCKNFTAHIDSYVFFITYSYFSYLAYLGTLELFPGAQDGSINWVQPMCRPINRHTCICSVSTKLFSINLPQGPHPADVATPIHPRIVVRDSLLICPKLFAHERKIYSYVDGANFRSTTGNIS